MGSKTNNCQPNSKTTSMYSTKTREELIVICKERGIKGYSGKRRDAILDIIYSHTKKQKQDTGKFRTNTKDQFYTKKEVASECVQCILDKLPSTKEFLWVEPSAGNGSFLHSIPPAFEKIGLDIEPNSHDIQQQDYLQWTPPTDKNIIVFGNPPFGRQSSLAKLFIKKSCEFATVIAFVLPKSFTKPSMFNAFDAKFHLLQTMELDNDSFLINDESYSVPCVFQIWKREEFEREKPQKIYPNSFEYVRPPTSYHVAFRRVGGLAGKCYKCDGTEFSTQSHYFLRFEDDVCSYIDDIIEKINNHKFPSNTVGPRSLSKSEINIVINDIIEALPS